MNAKRFLLLVAIVFAANCVAFSQALPVNIGDTVLGTGQNFKPNNILTDVNGNLWIAYSKAGIAKYDGTEFTHFSSANLDLPTDTIYDIYIVGNQIFASTHLGVVWADCTSEPVVWQTIPQTGAYCIYTLTVLNNSIYALSGDGSIINNLLRINLPTNSVATIPIESFSFLQGNRNIITSDNDNTIYWGGRNSNGIYKYNGTVTKIIDIVAPFKLNSMFTIGNNLWYSLSAGLVNIYNLDNGTTFQITDMSYFDETFNYRDAYITKDGMNRIYILNKSGAFVQVCRIDGSSSEIFQYRDTYSINASRSLTFAPQGSFYISCFASNKIYRINPDDFIDIMANYTNKNYKFFDRNKVKASVRSYGSIFWDGQGKAQYTVPAENGTNSLFATALWIGGYDQAHNLRLSAERFGQGADFSSFDFLPGPLTTGEIGEAAKCDTTTCVQFNKVWKIDRSDILAHISNIENGYSDYVSPDLYSWPAKGPIGYDQNLAPFYDANNDGIYNPASGDYPELKGDQMLWWVRNDIIAPHNETGGVPLGIEVQYTLYGYLNENPTDEWADLPNYQTYLNAKIINRSVNSYDSVFCGIWTDADLGNAEDDYVGCDVERSSYYFYNGDNNDETTSHGVGYGTNPPIQTITFLNAPYSNPTHENIFMSKFVYFNNENYLNFGDPTSDIDYYNYLKGFKKDCSQIIYNTGTTDIIPTDYMFPGNSDPSFIGTHGVAVPDWWDYSPTANIPGDRRGIGSSGPFNLAAGQEIEIDVLFGFLQAPNLKSETGFFEYGPQLDTLISWWNNNNTPSNYNPTPSQIIGTIGLNPDVKLYPNPATGSVNISCEINIDQITIYDIRGQKVKQLSPQNTESLINVQNYSPGVYIIEIKGKDYIKRERLLIQ